jgi:predicted heme/steroid binding protein
MKTRKILILFVSIIVFSIILLGCSKAPTQSTNTENLKEYTLEELAKYNGADGNPAYVAVDGLVYDVTNALPWKGGKHNGFEAGKDLSDEIKNISPHGVSKLKSVPIVGKITE